MFKKRLYNLRWLGIFGGALIFSVVVLAMIGWVFEHDNVNHVSNLMNEETLRKVEADAKGAIALDRSPTVKLKLRPALSRKFNVQPHVGSVREVEQTHSVPSRAGAGASNTNDLHKENLSPAKNSDLKAEQGLIAIVLDDAGLNLPLLERLLNMNHVRPLTISFLPYATSVQQQVTRSRAAGHEIFLHLPMEPKDQNQDPGPNALITGLAKSELTERFEWNMSRFQGYVGVNNHMGSRFTSNEPSMRMFLEQLSLYGVIFLDSKTSPDSIGAEIARNLQIPTIERDIFLDNTFSIEHVLSQLEKAERIARKKGYVLAIGHLQGWTVDALEYWAPRAQRKGFELVTVSRLLNRKVR